MKKDERTLITDQTIHRELLQKCKGEFIAFVISLAIVLLMAIPLTVFAFGQSHPIPKVLVILIDLYLVANGLYLGVPAFRSWRIVAGRRYEVVEDTLVGIGVEERVRKPWSSYRKHSRYRTESALYFDGYGRVVTTKRVCDHSIVGDTFYLVVCEDKKKPILLFYNTKTNRYETEEPQDNLVL